MQNHHRHSNQNRHQDVQPHAREDQAHDRHDPKRNQHHSIIHHPVEHHDRLVAEEVEQEPEHEDRHEHYHRDRVVEQAEKENEENNRGVIDSEVAEIAIEARGEVTKAEGHGVWGRVSQELAPRAARGVEYLRTRFDAEEDPVAATAVRR